MPEKILEVQSNAQFKADYTRYGIYILYRRVLSDYRDGLKPVQRRIIWAMYKNSKAITSNVKSAAVVGDVMKLYHPHGDIASQTAKCVRDRLRQEHTIYPQTHSGQQQGQRHHDNGLAQQGEKDGMFGIPQRLEGGLSRKLEGHEHKAEEINFQSANS